MPGTMARKPFGPRVPRRLETPPTASPADRGFTLTGTLIRIHDRGYGFLGTGKGNSDYFVNRSEVPAQAWVKGARFGFDPAPPRRGTRTPRAVNLVVISVPKETEERTADDGHCYADSRTL